MVRRKFTQGVKLEAVKVIKERGVTVVQAACDLGVHGMVLHWPVESAAAYFAKEAL
jgi:transposase